MKNINGLKLGRKPSPTDHRDLVFLNYFNANKLPSVPHEFGDNVKVPSWGMEGNNSVGNCVIAAIIHIIMKWNAAKGKTVTFTTERAIEIYSAITGYNPNNPSTDHGTNERDALKYWMNTGFTDDAGTVHKLGGFVRIDPANLAHLDAATYIFEAVLVGIMFPDSAMQQFQEGKPWDVVATDPTPDEGHGIPLVAKRLVNSLLDRICVTWGQEQPMTHDFTVKYVDEAWGLISSEMMQDDKTLEGFTLADFQKDSKLVSNNPVTTSL